MDSYKKWFLNIDNQIKFYKKNNLITRSEESFPWKQIKNNNTLKQRIKNFLIKNDMYSSNEYKWFIDNSSRLHLSRELFNDDLSKHYFDTAILIKVLGHNKFYNHFSSPNDYILKINSTEFNKSSFPNTYLASPLKNFECKITGSDNDLTVKIIATDSWVNFQNTYSQYLINFNDISFFPKVGDTIFDCGSCIGEVSILFGALVGATGSVHLFDPVPLHIRFCELQAKNNPQLENIFKMAQYAVGDHTSINEDSIDDSNEISPGKLILEKFSTITIDDYVIKNNIQNVNYIKMDIEGAECDALKGSRNTINKFKPKLAISAYHKPDDFWVIPELIKKINPDYKLYFAHHSPVSWESVIYASL